MSIFAPMTSITLVVQCLFLCQFSVLYIHTWPIPLNKTFFIILQSSPLRIQLYNSFGYSFKIFFFFFFHVISVRTFPHPLQYINMAFVAQKCMSLQNLQLFGTSLIAQTKFELFFFLNKLLYLCRSPKNIDFITLAVRLLLLHPIIYSSSPYCHSLHLFLLL